jgi:hypothetical protein
VVIPLLTELIFHAYSPFFEELVPAVEDPLPEALLVPGEEYIPPEALLVRTAEDARRTVAVRATREV